MRDNLFEMVTSSRTFYIQVTSMDRTDGPVRRSTAVILSHKLVFKLKM